MQKSVRDTNKWNLTIAGFSAVLRFRMDIKNRGEAAQYKATASHQAIITREQFEAAQREKEHRCNVEGSGAQRVRKSVRYKSAFSIDKFISEMEE